MLFLFLVVKVNPPQMRWKIPFRFDNRQLADLVAEQSRGLVYGLRVVSCKTQIVLGPNDKNAPDIAI